MAFQRSQPHYGTTIHRALLCLPSDDINPMNLRVPHPRFMRVGSDDQTSPNLFSVFVGLGSSLQRHQSIELEGAPPSFYEGGL